MTLLTLCLILPISRVRSVTVDSNDKQLRVAVIKASGLHYYESLFNVWFNASKIENKIQSKVGLVEQATLRYVDVNNIVIDVKEDPQVGYIYRNNKYYKIGTTGRPLSEGTPIVKGSYPVFYNFKDKAKLKLAVTKIQELPTELKKSVSEIHYDPSKVNPDRIKLYMNDGNEVIADLSTLTKKMEYYPQIATKMEQKASLTLKLGHFHTQKIKN